MRKILPYIVGILIICVLMMDMLLLYTYRPENWQLWCIITFVSLYIEVYLNMVWYYVITHKNYFEGK